jgi:hypothetical protein
MFRLTRRVDLYNGTTNHNVVYMSDPIDVQLISQKCDIIYARVTVTRRVLPRPVSIVSALSVYCTSGT